MKTFVSENADKRINKLLDWIIYISGYTLTLYLVDVIFNAFEVDNLLYYFWGSIILFILNKTIKKIVFKLTLPITGLTFGLFYFVIDFLMLKIVDFVLGNHFDIYGIWWGLFIAVSISVIHFILEELILKPLMRKM
jgi:putative membrane protein